MQTSRGDGGVGGGLRKEGSEHGLWPHFIHTLMREVHVPKGWSRLRILPLSEKPTATRPRCPLSEGPGLPPQTFLGGAGQGWQGWQEGTELGASAGSSIDSLWTQGHKVSCMTSMAEAGEHEVP